VADVEAWSGEGDERALLQSRLALFCGVTLVIDLLGAGAQLFTIPESPLTPAFLTLVGLLVLCFVGLVLTHRTEVRSRRFLETLEAALMLSIALGSAVIAHAIPAQAADVLLGPQEIDDPVLAALGPSGVVLFMQMGALLGATQAFVLRAAVVPSSGRRTALLGVLAGVVLAALAVLPLPGWPADARLRASLPGAVLSANLASTVIWWSLTTITCMAMSEILHGLRRSVREARRLGQYVLGEKLGQGGMGVVYRAQHALLRRDTAVKLVTPSGADARANARFEREVRSTATLTHPNTVTVYDYGHTADGVFYYAMELLDGAALDRIVEADGPFPPERVVHVLQAICGALVEAHERGLVHRDIKPGNIMLVRQGGEEDVPKLLDFGLVKELTGGGAVGATAEGALTGTPLYMAPEVIKRADAAGPASDLYALGAVAYYLLTGTHVFAGDTVVEVCGHHLHSEPQRPTDRLGAPVPEVLEELVLWCLAKDPTDRPASARALQRQLRAIEDVAPWTPEAAAAWWADHSALREATPSPSTPGEATIRVDIAHRWHP
jgi:hypothetical protein